MAALANVDRLEWVGSGRWATTSDLMFFVAATGHGEAGRRAAIRTG
jgi:hypothetical protein